MYLNDNFKIFTAIDGNINNLVNKNNLLEIFSFKDEENIISYNTLEFYEGNEMKKIKLSDFILRNLFVDLKKFSQNKFDTNSEDILFTKINI